MNKLVLSVLLFAVSLAAAAQEHRVKNYPDGGIMYDGYFVDGKPTEITRYTTAGKMKSHQVFDKNGDSKIEIYNDDATPLAKGSYKGKHRDGEWTFYGSNGKVSMIQNFKDSLRDGLTELFYESGEIMERLNYKNDMMDGTRTQYYPDGKEKSVLNYTGGVLNGEFKSYYGDGTTDKEGVYKNGKRDGVWKFYNEKGEVEEFKFNMGKCKKYDEMIRKASRESEKDPHIPEPDSGNPQ